MGREFQTEAKTLRKCPRKRNSENLHKCLIYRKLMRCQVGGMRSIAGIVLNHSAFDRKVCNRSHVTALNSHGRAS